MLYRTQAILKIYLLCTFIFLINGEHQLNKRTEGEKIAIEIFLNFFTMFYSCVNSPIPNQNFLTDNLQGFVNHPSKTTVGFAPKFTSNRKFFANLVSTTAFKEMLSNDENSLRKSLINKLKYCDEAIMDQEILKDFYDREAEPSKI